MRAVRTRVLSHAGTEVGLYESHCIAARLAMLITLSVLSSILWTLTSLVRLFLSVAYITPHTSQGILLTQDITSAQVGLATLYNQSTRRIRIKDSQNLAESAAPLSPLSTSHLPADRP